MAIKLGFEDQREKKSKEKLVKKEARELQPITHEALNTDFYMPSLTQKLEKDSDEVLLPRHEIISMIQDELKSNGIPYDLGLRIVEDVMQVVIKSKAFTNVTDEAYAHIAEYLAQGEFVVQFSQFDEDGAANYVIEEGAPTEYWLNKATPWDVKTMPVLRTFIGTVGKVKLCAHFTNEGLNFETFTNRFVTDDGKLGCTDKMIKGFALQQ